MKWTVLSPTVYAKGLLGEPVRRFLRSRAAGGSGGRRVFVPGRLEEPEEQKETHGSIGYGGRTTEPGGLHAAKQIASGTAWRGKSSSFKKERKKAAGDKNPGAAFWWKAACGADSGRNACRPILATGTARGGALSSWKIFYAGARQLGYPQYSFMSLRKSI